MADGKNIPGHSINLHDQELPQEISIKAARCNINVLLHKGFVSTSACCSAVPTYKKRTSPTRTNLQIKWSFTSMCLVLNALLECSRSLSDLHCRRNIYSYLGQLRLHEYQHGSHQEHFLGCITQSNVLGFTRGSRNTFLPRTLLANGGVPQYHCHTKN